MRLERIPFLRAGPLEGVSGNHPHLVLAAFRTEDCAAVGARTRLVDAEYPPRLEVGECLLHRGEVGGGLEIIVAVDSEGCFDVENAEHAADFRNRVERPGVPL